MDGSLSGSNERQFTAAFLFSGIGVGALGFLDAQIDINGQRGRFRSLGGIDLDPIACRSFERLTGSPCYERDIAKMTGAELRELFGPKAPHTLFLSAPCQGFSGLISEEKAAQEKYQALNRLAVTAMELVYDAWGDDGPNLIVFENVPRIASRGANLLKQVRKVLRKAGYVFHEGTHNCGRIGRLAQSRERFLMVARHARKTPVFLYQPPEHDLRPCGEVIERLPLPGHPGSGRLHTMPKISARTWMRLAAIRPGKDWRDLSTLDGEVRPNWSRYAIAAWFSPTGAVTGTGTNSAWGLADVRVQAASWNDGAYGVTTFSSPLGAVTSGAGPSSGAFSIADLRVSMRGHGMHWKVLDGAGPAPTITGTTDVQAGAPSIADVRLSTMNADRHTSKYHVGAWDEPARTITGTDGRVGSGAPCMADVRVGHAFRDAYGVLDLAGPSRAITGEPGVPNGANAVADVRVSPSDVQVRVEPNYGCYGVAAFGDPIGTVTGNQAPGGGTTSVADVRVDDEWFRHGLQITCTPWKNSGVLGVLGWFQPSYTITGALDLWAGYAACADIRPDSRPCTVVDGVVFEGEVTRSNRTATPRARTMRPVQPIAPGRWWASDLRIPSNPRLRVLWQQSDLDEAPPYIPVIPGRGDGSWHRPITLLERAALQGLPLELEGRALDLEGTTSQVAKHIGNAVPVGAAQAIASEMLRTLVLAARGSFMLSNNGIWVKRRPNGTFPLYVEQELKRMKAAKRRRARKAVEKIARATRYRVVSLALPDCMGTA